MASYTKVRWVRICGIAKTKLEQEMLAEGKIHTVWVVSYHRFKSILFINILAFLFLPFLKICNRFRLGI